MQTRGTAWVSRGRSPRPWGMAVAAIRRPQVLRPVMFMVLLLGVACAQPDPSDPVVVLREALASHQASLAGIAPRTAAAGGEGSVAPSVAPLGAPAPTAPARPRSGAGEAGRAEAGGSPTMAGQFVGHAPGTVIAWLGEPRLRREEGNAEIWHYQGPQCHLDLFFYRDDVPGAGLRVAFAAARAIGTARRGEAACLRDIARGAGGPAVPAALPEELPAAEPGPEPVAGA